jgi:hypothetical protein
MMDLNATERQMALNEGNNISYICNDFKSKPTTVHVHTKKSPTEYNRIETYVLQDSAMVGIFGASS